MDLETIKAGMRERGIKQVDLANAMGILPKAVSLSLSGQRQFKAKEVDIIRSLLGGPTIALPGEAMRSIPIVGKVTAGSPSEGKQQLIGTMPSPDPSLPGSALALVIEGDSMNDFVQDGGRIIYDPEDRALFPRRLYVVINEAGETTFKRFFADPARLEPCSDNPEHKTLILGGGDVFTVVGRVVWFASRPPG